MQNEPLVSIITPCYNHEKYLSDYFESVISQIYNNIELIIFDDASKDKSREVIEKWLPELKERFTRVLYVPRERNVGVVRNCNEGLELAYGKYIFFFASDDIMLPIKINESVSFLEKNNKCGMVYSNVKLLKKGKICRKPLFDDDMPSGDIFINLLTNKNYIPAPSVCIRRDVFDNIGKFNEYIGAEDYQMWIKISEKYEVGYINRPLAIYRLHIKSLSHSKEFKAGILDVTYEFKKGFIKSEKVDEKIILEVLKNTSANFAKTAFYNNDIKGFIKYYNNYVGINKDNISSNYKLKVMSCITKIPFIYKSIIWFIHIVQYLCI